MSKKQSIVGKSKEHEVSKMNINALKVITDELENHDDRLTNLEDTMRINGVQEHKIREAGTRAVMKALGGKKTPAYKELSRSAFSRMWHEFNHYFEIPRYAELPAKQYQQGIEFAATWEPNQEMKMHIKRLNSQMDLFKGDERNAG